MNTTGIVILCVLLYLIIFVFSFFSLANIDDDETDEYQIVGSQEANPFESKISNESPIAQALLNRKVGEIVDVNSPNGVYQVEITSIK